jgi:hypothetical protein
MMQVDWEAILSQHPDAFMERLSKWMVPEQVLAAWEKARQPQEAAAGQEAAASSSSSTAAPDTPGGTSDNGGSSGGKGTGSGSTTSSRGGSPGGSPGSSPRGVALSAAALTNAAKALPSVSTLGRVNDVLGTMRARIEALNGSGMPRI